MGIIQQCTHPSSPTQNICHPPSPTQKNVPLTPIHSPTENNPQYTPTHPHPPKIISDPPKHSK